MNKKYSLGKGKYYFSINSGLQKILIHRKSKNEAIQQYINYKKVGKDCEWLGCWNGKKFDETSLPATKN